MRSLLATFSPNFIDGKDLLDCLLMRKKGRHSLMFTIFINHRNIYGKLFTKLSLAYQALLNDARIFGGYDGGIGSMGAWGWPAETGVIYEENRNIIDKLYSSAIILLGPECICE